jgi:hypothetical protein
MKGFIILIGAVFMLILFAFLMTATTNSEAPAYYSTPDWGKVTPITLPRHPVPTSDRWSWPWSTKTPFWFPEVPTLYPWNTPTWYYPTWDYRTPFPPGPEKGH